MADAPNTVTTLDGNFRETYADKLENLTPSGIQLQKDIPFVKKSQMPGNNYHQPVLLTHEHGFTYAANGAGAFSLNDATAGYTADATLTGTQMLLKTQIDYETAARASSGKPRAFKQALSIVVENMWESSKKRCEIDYFYGQRGLGKVSTVNNTTGVITIATADWAPGIWAGQEKARLVAYSTVSAAATLHSGTAGVVISKVDFVNKQITVTGTVTNIVTNSHLWFYGQRTATAHNVFKGMHEIMAATGTKFGVSATTYSLWGGNTYAVGGALTFGKIQKAVAEAMGKGLDEDLVLYINPGAWVDLLNDEAALRRHVKGGRETMYYAGAGGIEFASQNGIIKIKSSVYVKEGLGFMFSPKLWRRVGATDLTFNLPDRGDEFFRHVDDKAAYELRNYINHALFTKAPGKAILLTGIVNS